MPAITNLAELEQTPHAEVFDDGSPRTVRLELAAGDQIPAHQHPGTSIVLHLLRGEVELELDGGAYALEPADVVRFSGDQDVAPRAIEDATALVVFSPAEEA
jgi:quercetin dioxygenase-like cupin family protein